MSLSFSSIILMVSWGILSYFLSPKETFILERITQALITGVCKACKAVAAILRPKPVAPAASPQAKLQSTPLIRDSRPSAGVATTEGNPESFQSNYPPVVINRTQKLLEVPRPHTFDGSQENYSSWKFDVLGFVTINTGRYKSPLHVVYDISSCVDRKSLAYDFLSNCIHELLEMSETGIFYKHAKDILNNNKPGWDIAVAKWVFTEHLDRWHQTHHHQWQQDLMEPQGERTLREWLDDIRRTQARLGSFSRKHLVGMGSRATYSWTISMLVIRKRKQLEDWTWEDFVHAMKEEETAIWERRGWSEADHKRILSNNWCLECGWGNHEEEECRIKDKKGGWKKVLSDKQWHQAPRKVND